MKILLYGFSGKMGQAIISALSSDDQVIMGVDRHTPVNESLLAKIDLAMDFSSPEGTLDLIEIAQNYYIPVVIGTTGLNEEQKQKIFSAAQKIKIFYASNFSVGINVLNKLIQLATYLLPKKFQIEIIERHHRHKKDAPSGTAVTFLETIQQVRSNTFPVYGRRGRTERTDNEIGIHSLRCGEIFGEHEVIFEGEQEEITLKHRAFDRKIFAKGALFAAKWLLECKQPYGLFSMNDLIDFSDSK